MPTKMSDIQSPNAAPPPAAMASSGPPNPADIKTPPAVQAPQAQPPANPRAGQPQGPAQNPNVSSPGQHAPPAQDDAPGHGTGGHPSPPAPTNPDGTVRSPDQPAGTGGTPAQGPTGTGQARAGASAPVPAGHTATPRGHNVVNAGRPAMTPTGAIAAPGSPAAQAGAAVTGQGAPLPGTVMHPDASSQASGRTQVGVRADGAPVYVTEEELRDGKVTHDLLLDRVGPGGKVTHGQALNG